MPGTFLLEPRLYYVVTMASSIVDSLLLYGMNDLHILVCKSFDSLNCFIRAGKHASQHIQVWTTPTCTYAHKVKMAAERRKRLVSVLTIHKTWITR